MRSHSKDYSVHAMRALWFGVRVPVFLFLKILEPVVTFVFSGLALLGLLATFFYPALGMPHFPFWTMLALSLGFGAVVMVYQSIVRMLEA